MAFGIKAKKVYCENEILEDALLIVEGGIIKEIVTEKYDGNLNSILDMSIYNVIPGLVDMHIHGVNGYDTMNGDFESINEISKYLASKGVTAFLPTTVTDDIGKVKKALKNVQNSIGKVAGAEILGAYVEGPYITKEHKGAHPESMIKELTIDEIEELIRISEDAVKIITIAPEKNNAKGCIEYLKKKGVQVAMGHTNAKYDEAISAIKAGANIAVHTFNGMKGFNHREPGFLGAVLTKDAVYCELICDLVHVHPAAIELLLKCKTKDKVVLISDAMQATGLSDGDYMLGSLAVRVQDSIARINNGSLAGSTTNLLSCVKNMVEKLGVSPCDAIQMASLNPSKVLGVEEYIGSIKKGKKANFAIVDDEFELINTMVNGEIVYSKLDN